MRTIWSLLSVAIGGLLTQPAWSADPLAQKIEACAQQQVDATRLQCFDRVVAELRKEPSRSAPAEKPRDKPTVVQPPATQPVTARVASVSKAAGGELRIELDNGQVWQENEHDASLMLSAGDSVQIRPGALKSSILRAPSGVNAKVRRVR